MMNVKTAANKLGVSGSMIYKLMNLGQLNFIKVGGRKVIDPNELERFITDNTKKASLPPKVTKARPAVFQYY